MLIESMLRTWAIFAVVMLVMRVAGLIIGGAGA